MVTALVGTCVVLAIAVGILIIEVWSLPRRRCRVMVNLLGDEGTIEGVLWTRRGPWLVVKDARLWRTTGGDSVAIDGETLIDVRHVSFVQVL